jgi:Icc-related predicted phosphoesterase
MQVLTVSDEVKREIYGPTAQTRFRDVQLVLGCGDLPPSYLEFIVSTLNVPCLYVPGNHDARPEVTEAGNTVTSPGGWTNIHGRLVNAAGLWVFGFGGSPWYNGQLYQYTDFEMFTMVLRLYPRLALRARRNGRPLDIMIAHAAAQGVLDGPRVHRGFKAFRWLIDRLQPRYFIHGHVHPSYGYSRETEATIGQTRVINTVGYRLLDIPVDSVVTAGERVVG